MIYHCFEVSLIESKAMDPFTNVLKHLINAKIFSHKSRHSVCLDSTSKWRCNSDGYWLLISDYAFKLNLNAYKLTLHLVLHVVKQHL